MTNPDDRPTDPQRARRVAELEAAEEQVALSEQRGREHAEAKRRELERIARLRAERYGVEVEEAALG